MQGWRTFSMCIVVLVLAFWGGYVNMFDPATVKEILWGVMATYGLKSVGSKFAVGYNNKHNKADGPESVE